MKRNRWRESSFEKWIEDKGDSASQFLSYPRDSIVFRLNSSRNNPIRKIGDEPSFSIDFWRKEKKKKKKKKKIVSSNISILTGKKHSN